MERSILKLEKYREDRGLDKCKQFPIWNLSFCKVEGIVKNRKLLQRKGLTYVQDLFNENGNILGYEDFKTKFGVNINFVHFYALTHSLRQEWKEHSTQNDGPSVKDDIKKIRQTKKLCRYIYLHMVNQIKCDQTCQQKWQKVGMNVTDEEWKLLYKSPFVCTMESKLQAFQYQILKRSLVTNKLLCIYKIKDTNKCHFCNSGVETIEHLFYDCNIVRKFWLDLSNILPVDLNSKKVMCRKDVLVGNTYDNNNLLL